MLKCQQPPIINKERISIMPKLSFRIQADYDKVQRLREEISKLKQEIEGTDASPKAIEELNAKLRGATLELNAIIDKMAKADAKLMESAARIDKAVDAITKAQEKAAKANAKATDTAASKAQTAALEGQAKAYLDLKDEIDSILGTREQNIRQMMQEQNAIKLINAEIAQINKSRQYGGGLTATQSQRLQQLNDSLLTHKQALAEVRQELNNNAKLDIAAVGSMNELSQSLSRMRIAYRALNEDERNSLFGQNLLKSIQEADARIKELDATIGNHQRNVGNYQGRFNGLNMSVQQIVRELPSATMGINMFFMAISNNLPIMADQIKMAKEFNKEMKAAGSEPVPVWKQLVSSIFSWQTAMMVGITLLTVYGKDIANWVKGLFKANDAQEQARKEAEAFANTIKKSHEDWRNSVAQTASQQITSYRKMQREWNALGNNLNDKKKYVDANKTAFNQLGFAVNGVSDAERVMVGNTDAVVASIMARVKAAAYEAEIQKANAEYIRQTDYNKGTVKGGGYFQKFHPMNNQTTEVSELEGLKEGKDFTRQMAGMGANAQFIYTLTASGIAKVNARRERESAKKLAENQKKADAQLKKRLKFLQGGLESVTKENQGLLKKIGVSEYKDYKETNSPKNGKTEKVGKKVDYDKIAREQSDAERELEEKASQSRIDAMQESYEKEKAQRELNHRKELDDLEKYQRDFLQKKIDDAKEIFEAAPKNKGKKFNASTVTLSADEQSKFDQMRDDTLAKQANEDKDYQRQQIDALNAYLKEYGTFEDKKLAITQEYEEKIRKAGSVGEKATLEMQRDKDIEKAKNDDLQNSIDWNGVFSDLQGHTKQYLQGLRNQLQELLNTGNLPIDQMQTVSDKINAIDDELGKQQGIWDFVGERTREHNRLLKEAADAQERLNVAKAEETGANFKLNTIKTDIQKRLSDAGVDMNIGDISTASLNGKIDLTDEKFKGMATILQRLAVAEGKLTEARKKTTDATYKAKQKEDAAKRKPAQEIADWFNDAQEFITKKGIDQLPDLLNSVGLGNAGEKVGKGLDGFNSAAGAAADFASGNYIGAAFKGISAIKSFGSALGIGAGNAAEVNRTTERLRESNEHLAERIDDLSEVIGDSAGARAVNAYDTALKAQEEINRNNMEILRAQMGYHSAHHSNASYADDRKIASYNNDAQLAFKAAGVSASTINGLSSIYSLTPEQLKAIKDFAPDLWKYLTEVGKYDKSEYWDAVVEQAGKTEELTEQIQNNLTQTNFDSLRSGFLDTLMDMDADAEDWSKNFEKMLFKSMVSTNVLDDDFNDWLKDFQKKWAEKVKSGSMSQSDYADYRDEYNRMMEELKTQTNNFAASIGYSDTNSAQKATANGVTEITYEQANNIVALTTAGNVTRDQIKDRLTLMNATMDDIRALMNQSPASYASDTRQIINNSYIPQIQVSFPKEELQDIKHDVRELRGIVDEMRTHGADRILIQQQATDDIARIAKNGMEIKSYVLDIKKDTKNLQ